MPKGKEQIIIEFLPKGDKKLIQAFQGLAKAQTKFNTTTNQVKGAYSKLNPVAQSLTAKLTAQGKTWKKLGVETKTVSLAFQGNKVAIERLKMAYKKQNTANRILGGSFAVLRSKMLITSFAISILQQTLGRLMKAFDEFQRASIQVETTIKTTGGSAGLASHQIEEFANELQKTANVSNTVTMQASAMMLTFTKISGDIFPRAMKSATDLSMAFGQDMKSSVIQLGKALNQPQIGLTALRRIGISFSQEQKKQINNFIELNDLASAQAVILDELEIEFGGVSETMAKSGMGAWTSAWNTWTDVAKKAGEGFVFILKPLALLIEGLGAGFIIYSDWLAKISGKTENKKLASEFDFLRTSSKRFLNTLDSLSPKLQQQLADIGVTEKGFRQLRLEAGQSDEGFKKYQDTLVEWDRKLQATITTSKINIEEQEKHRKKMGEVNAEWARENQAKFIEHLNSQKDAWMGNEREAFKYGETLMNIQAKFSGFQSEWIGLSEEEEKLLRKKVEIAQKGAKLFADGVFTQAEALEWIHQKEKDLDNEMLAHKVEHYAQQAKLVTSSFSNMTSAQKAKLDAEVRDLKASEGYQKASTDSKKRMEENLAKKQAKERTKLAQFDKATNFANAGINIATAITDALPNIPLAVLIGAMGAVQLGAIASTPIPKYARGGAVGGRRHSQGGTMIEAEQGEFVMSRNAVQAVGLENMNRINAGGGAGAVNISFSGNVMSQDFIEDEAIPMIKTAIRRGADIGVS